VTSLADRERDVMADLPRFVISKVDDVTRSQDAEQQQTDSSAEPRSTDTPVNGNVRFHV